MAREFLKRALSLLVILSHLMGQVFTVGCHASLELDDTFSIALTPLMGGVDILDRAGPSTTSDGKRDPDPDLERRVNLASLNNAIETARLQKLPEIEKEYGVF